MNIKYAIGIAGVIIAGVFAQQSEAATVHNPGSQDFIVSQNEVLTFDVTDSREFSLTFQGLSQDWSYSAGGVVQVFDGTTQYCAWCGITVGSWQLSKWVQEAVVSWSFPSLTDYQIRVYGTHGDSHLHYLNVGSVDTPAPVPVGPGAVFLLTGLAGLWLARAINSVKRGDPDVVPESCGWA